MTEVVRSRQIAAPRDQVWEALADFGALATWAPDIDHSSLLHTPQDDPIGTTRRVQNGRLALLERIVIHRPPEVLAYDIQGLPPVIRSLRNQWNLTEVGSDTTEVTLTSTIDAGPRPPQKLIARLVGRRIATVDQMLIDGLAAHVEGTDSG